MILCLSGLRLGVPFRKLMSRSLSGLCLSVLVLLGAAPPCQSEYVFGPPLWLEPDDYRQLVASISVDSEGNPCVVWVDMRADIRFAKSIDGGETFLSSVVVGATLYPGCWPRVALDSRDNPHVVWTDLDVATDLLQVRYSKSTDGGSTFLPSLYVDPDTSRQFATGIVVDSSSNPMIVWEGYPRGGSVEECVYFTRSYDGGSNFVPSILVDSHPGYQVVPDIALDFDQNIYISYSGDDWFCYRYVFVVKSTDGGQSFGDRVCVDRDPSCGSTSSISVVPPSGDSSGVAHSLMIVWNESKDPGVLSGIYFAKSTDRGVTFESVVTVTEPEGGDFPAIAADNSGNPFVVWVDNETGQLHFSYSRDEGLTFSQKTPVDTETVFDDHYPDIVVSKLVVPMVVWTDTRTAHLPLWQVYFAKGTLVGVEEAAYSWKSGFQRGVLQNVPNPFQHSTLVSYSLPAATEVTLAVYDITGRLVETLVNETQHPGMHQVQWNRGTNPSGVYFYTLNAGEYVKTRKMVVVE